MRVLLLKIKIRQIVFIIFLSILHTVKKEIDIAHNQGSIVGHVKRAALSSNMLHKLSLII